MIKLAVLLAVFLSVGGWSYAQKALDDYGHPSPAAVSGCEKPDGVVDIGFNKTTFPHIRRHQLRSIREGWPSVYTINRTGADARRDKALEGVPTKKGFDRDESPAAMLRRTWHTDVALVPSSENRRHGAVMGAKLRRYCDGVKVKFVWY